MADQSRPPELLVASPRFATEDGAVKSASDRSSHFDLSPPTKPPVSYETAWDGAALRTAREQAGLTLQEMAHRTKINVTILRALEEERFEDAPKARVYVRGFVCCMAEEIGVDPKEVAHSYVPRWERWFEQIGDPTSY